MSIGRGSQEVTYRQLKNGWLRCVQTGEWVKNSKKHRFMFLRNRYPRHSQVVKQVQQQPKKVKKDAYFPGIMAGEFLGYVDGFYKYRCPYCGRINSSLFKTSMPGCEFCYRVFSAET